MDAKETEKAQPEDASTPAAAPVDPPPAPAPAPAPKDVKETEKALPEDASKPAAAPVDPPPAPAPAPKDGKETEVLEARVARSASGNEFNDLFETAQRHFQNLTAAIQNALPTQDEVRTSIVKTQDEVREQLQTHAQTFANNLQAAATQFNEKAAQLSGDAQTAVRQAAQHLEQQVSNLRQQFPDGAQAADKLKASIESALAEARRVQEAVQPHADAVAESLKSAARTAVEQATVITNQVQQSVQQASNAH